MERRREHAIRHLETLGYTIFDISPPLQDTSATTGGERNPQSGQAQS
jgi:hypothetical protein